MCRGGSVSFTGSVDMELVKRWKCAVYHFVTVGCGFLRGGRGPLSSSRFQVGPEHDPIWGPYEQTTQPCKVQLCKGMQDAHMFK